MRRRIRQRLLRQAVSEARMTFGRFRVAMLTEAVHLYLHLCVGLDLFNCRFGYTSLVLLWASLNCIRAGENAEPRNVA